MISVLCSLVKKKIGYGNIQRICNLCKGYSSRLSAFACFKTPDCSSCDAGFFGEFKLRNTFALSNLTNPKYHLSHHPFVCLIGYARIITD